jgi:hypothetical protein
MVCIDPIFIEFSTSQCLSQQTTIPITHRWWNVMTAVNEECHVINFWISIISFEQELQKWEFMLYEKVHLHFMLNYALVSCNYVDWAIIWFQKVKGFVELCASGLQHKEKANVHRLIS